MSLRKSPERTPAFLAAQRRNAQKCRGPKTPEGKARSSLNALKHGQYARNLLARMRALGVREVAGLFKFRNQLLRLYKGKAGRILAERSANTVASRIWRENRVRRNRSPFRRSWDGRLPGAKAVGKSRLAGSASNPPSALAPGEGRGAAFTPARTPTATDLLLLSPEERMKQLELLTFEQLQELKRRFFQSSGKKK